ncbi:phage tail protein [Alcaligenes sp. WGS1538]|uniref:phage tail protein n=1 Tax=Alcaligenes sp. WGS1538 TaxID=3366811 RepID=UPI00372CFA85
MTIAIEAKRGGQRIIGSGGGGGSSGRTPVEQPDSLHNTAYAVVLDVIGNGEMAGPVHAHAPLRDIFLDGTPIQNEDGSLNFQRVQVDFRLGTQDQEPIAGFPAGASVSSVGQEVDWFTPWTQLLTNPDLSAIRISLHWPQLMQMVESGSKAGDRIGVRVEYAIDLAVGSGSFENVLTTAVDGKTVNGYTRTHRIDLPASSHGWRVRVRRLSPDSTSSAVQSRMLVQSYAEVIDGKFRYPMTAMVGVKIDAEQFRSIPTRAYRWRGQLIRVPSNYDPQSRTYSGVWDGTFKRAWSNNPAWVFYDMLTNKLYGLGERLNAAMIDRYALYQIGAYCDERVSDGQGGTEPRFVCNAYLQSSADALRVVNDLASVFRGMSYWANGQVVGVADMPSDPVYTYTNARVIDGQFKYVGSDLGTLKTVALVSWSDPDDFYRAKVEVVQDEEGVRQFGIRKTELTAFGCTTRGQAQRVGLYHLHTARMEQGGVSFTVGLDGVIPQPGSLIRIADRNRAGRRLGGLIRQATGTDVTLDAAHPVKVGDQLTVNLPDGQAQSRAVVGVDGDVVKVHPAYSAAPQPEAGWSVDADDLLTQQARVIAIKERDGILFDVSAVFHHPGKFSAIDNGVRLEPLPVSVVPPRVQAAPTQVQIREHYVVRQGQSRHIAEISWKAVEHAMYYDVQWRRDNGGWVQVPRTGLQLVEIPDFYTGDYVVRVRAINALDVPSLWAYSPTTALTGQVAEPPAVSHLTTESIPWGVKVRWGFPAGPSIAGRVEIRYSATELFVDGKDGGSYAYPTDSMAQTSLAVTTQHFYWARIIDKNGTQGPWYPAESAPGVRGVPSQIASEYNDLITPEIVEGGLGEVVMGDIRDIPSIRDTVDEISVDLGELNGRVDEINGQVQELLSAGEWDPAAAYAVGTVVFADGKMYRAKKAVPAGTPVSDAAHWELIGDYASITDGLAALAVQAQETISRVDQAEGRIQANAEQISTVAGKVDDPSTGLGALGSAVQSMRTQAGQLESGLQSLSEATTALSSRVDGLDQAQQGLATAVSSLGTRVTATEGQLDSQASSITQLGASVSNADAKAVAAQQAAAAAADAAGAKGEVVFGSAAPLAAKRLPQNLWIDTTGNANTPKRWNGSAWVAVTDKAATDAAAAAVVAKAAADAAQAIASQKADASTVQALTNRVTATEQGLMAQGESVTKIDARLAAGLDSDSLLPDYMMANSDSWYSYYPGTDLAPNFIRVTDGKIAPTVFHFDTGRTFNFSVVTLPITQQYRIQAWMRRSPDSDGQMRITYKYRKTTDGDSGIQTNYSSASVIAQVPADGEWHLVDFVYQAAASVIADGFTGVRFGFAINYTSTRGWAEIQGYRVTRVVQGIDINPDEVATAQSVTSLSGTVTQQGNTITSQGRDLTALQNTVNDPSTGLAATAGALNDTKSRVTSIEGKQEAQATNQLVLNAEVKRLQGTEDADLESVLNQWQTRASVAQLSQAVADDSRAMAESIRIVQAEIDDVSGQAEAASAAIQETMRSLVELDGRIASSWGLKLQTNQAGVKYVAGVGLDLTNESGVMQSTFAVLADRFAVMHAANGSPATVFSVQGGASILNSALIGNASITSTKIADAAVTRAKIQDAAITRAKIEDAAISSAKIGIAEVDTLRLAGNAVTIHASVIAPYYQPGFVVDERSFNLQFYLPNAADFTLIANVEPFTIFGGNGTRDARSVIWYDNGGYAIGSVYSVRDLQAVLSTGGSTSIKGWLPAGRHSITMRQQPSFGASLLQSIFPAASMVMLIAMR